MFSLYKYELKKIFKQKYFILVSVVMTLFLIAIGITPYFLGSVSTYQENQVVSNRYIDDSLMDEARENNGKGIYSYISDFMKQSVNSNDIEGYSANDIYNKRLETIEKEMKLSYLNDAEWKYWKEKGREIETPFIYYADTGYAEVYDLISFLCVSVMTIVNVGIAEVFAGEKTSGADQIILCTKNGRKKLFMAKLLTSLTVGLIVPVFVFGLIVFVELMVFGPSGYDTPLQVHMPTCLYKISIGQSLFYCLFRIVASSLVWVCVSLFLSEITKKQTACLAFSIAMIFMTMLNIPERLGLISRIWHYLPGFNNTGPWMFSEYRMINLFGLLLNDFEASAFIWLILGVILLLVSYISYKNYEVKGR